MTDDRRHTLNLSYSMIDSTFYFDFSAFITEQYFAGFYTYFSIDDQLPPTPSRTHTQGTAVPQPRSLCGFIIVVIVVVVIVTVVTTVFPPLSCDLFDCYVFVCHRVLSLSSSGGGHPAHHICHHRRHRGRRRRRRCGRRHRRRRRPRLRRRRRHLTPPPRNLFDCRLCVLVPRHVVSP